MRLLVTGGGTGGHIYPAISIAKGYKKTYSNVKLLYVGRKEGLESDIVPKNGINYKSISITYLKKKKLGLIIKYLYSFSLAIIQSYKIIKEFKPDVIVGTGGYVTGPILLVGQILGIKTVIHESNAFPGRANKFFAKKAEIVFVSHENLKEKFSKSKKVVFSGTPVREEFGKFIKIDSRKKLNVLDDEFFVLSFAGSGGAKNINESVIELIKKISGNMKIKYVHVTGKTYFNIFLKRIRNQDISFASNVEIVPYIEDMSLYMSGADLLITRGGAMTLAEVAVSGTPSIIIPSPNVKDNHQEYNARAMVDSGAAIMLLEEKMDYFNLYNLIEELLNNRDKLSEMGKRCKEVAKNNATNIIVREIFKIKSN